MHHSKYQIEQYHLHKRQPGKLQFELYDLNAYRKKSGDLAAVPHSHSYYQIIWFINEGGTHVVDFKKYDIKKNTVLFIAKDQVHAFDDNEDVQGWLIHFNESFFKHTDVDMFLKFNIFHMLDKPCYTIEKGVLNVASAYITLIQSELEQRDRFGYEDIIRFLLKSFLIQLERIHQKNDSAPIQLNSLYKRQFFEFKELIEVHFKKGLSVGDYASLLHISSKTLSTLTNTVIGKSPSQVISERTVLEAKRLVRFTSLQINEIAFRLGFEDASYFVKYFKRHLGQSPKSYRQSQLA
ncbi:AraC family transcriptional regulator [Zobellia galactanivorans]|uniref:AraC family transcriptional regulator n=1 Tax=Zobellia galactanivorans (strain DSM 12802 / CCUG 47099 / CIP 106680 / NCIMB 13871 / Dsij) TaxID=63186 RepID=UPI001C06E46A|nr:AraC family transcriptional regulator [Zobellia galactanivorans]MBU3028256.1 AraC family transcriptional regulator [Zobellia galactanivorans]